jgi:hypothetical protein
MRMPTIIFNKRAVSVTAWPAAATAKRRLYGLWTVLVGEFLAIVCFCVGARFGLDFRSPVFALNFRPGLVNSTTASSWCGEYV